MTRYNDSSTDVSRWSTTKLFRELRKYANLESFEVGHNDIAATFKIGWHDQVNKDQPTVDDFVRDQTRIYRDSWLAPIIDALEQRFNPVAGKSANNIGRGGKREIYIKDDPHKASRS